MIRFAFYFIKGRKSQGHKHFNILIFGGPGFHLDSFHTNPKKYYFAPTYVHSIYPNRQIDDMSLLLCKIKTRIHHMHARPSCTSNIICSQPVEY